MQGEGGFRYSVLYTQVQRAGIVRQVLKKNLPREHGTVFYPRIEVYRRDKGGKVCIQPMFPGYVFLYTDLGPAELHGFILKNRSQVIAYIRELRQKEAIAAGETFRAEMSDAEKGLPLELAEVNEEEAEFLDFLLKTNGADVEASADVIADNEGLLKMSAGYKNGKQSWKVMEGPLKAIEGRISGVNAHNRRAYLDMRMNGHVISAGFDVRPKRYWYPEDEDAPEVLSDGTEVDLKELVRAMTMSRD